MTRVLTARPNHTIATLNSAASPRVVIRPAAGGVAVEIRPLVRTRGARWRLGLAGAAILAAALFGGARLARVWEAGLKKGSFQDLPLSTLVPVTLAVGVSTPFALLGLVALAFAEEQIEVTQDSIAIRSTAFERTRVRIIPRREVSAWVETYRPLPPWWTWAVRRLAARAGGRLVPLAGAAGQREKREIGLCLARATGLPLLAASGRPIEGPETAKILR